MEKPQENHDTESYAPPMLADVGTFREDTLGPLGAFPDTWSFDFNPRW